ncbi:MFS transporter [Nonomuraea jabiensis]|uniref:MFS family permease n=1 Tax=Nonomuraea jabiensis TaxID=882448 RepID=A0A7W9GCR1_9ACTN|nr:MFS transporter [Nonomuraea jabiensis]MBB5781374.1 MFS family permease [Nonomuraea jabiensis]
MPDALPAQDPEAVTPRPSDAPTPPPAAEPAPGRWLWVIYPLAMVAMNAVWGGVMQVLLGKQIAAIVPEQAASAAALGMALSVSAVSSVVSQPIAGMLSDRTRTRFLGRRNVWIFGAGIVGALGLVAMSQLTSTIAIAITWAAMMWPLNATQASLTAVLPERVPQRLRGSMSGVLGAAGLIGAYAGVALAGLSRDLFMGYLLVAGLFLLLTQIFALTTKDRPAPEPDARTAPGDEAGGTRLSLRGAPDYWWAFTGRFLLIFGYFSVSSFQLYILRDHIGLGDIDRAATTLVAISGLSTLLSLAFALLGGWISDKTGRLRLFVGVSSLMFVPAGLVYLLVPTLTGAWMATAVTGAAFGVYMAVDQALITRVLPGVGNTGRDLGIMNIANAGPQIIAPSVAGAVVGATGDYRLVFVLLIVCTALGALSVRFIKGVR